MTKRKKLEKALKAALKTGVTESELSCFLELRSHEQNVKEWNSDPENLDGGEPETLGEHFQGLIEDESSDLAEDVRFHLQDLFEFASTLEEEVK